MTDGEREILAEINADAADDEHIWRKLAYLDEDEEPAPPAGEGDA